MAWAEPTRTEDEHAIARVLEAERVAEEEVARCDAARNKALGAAREAVADVVTRAEHRLAARRRRLEAVADERIRALEASGDEELRSARPKESERERIARAAAALARELIGMRA